MSAISELTRQAIFTKLNVSGVTTLATGGVYYKAIPAGTTGPCVVFSRIPGSVDYALANNLMGERDGWMIQAVVDDDDDGGSGLEPPQLAEQILAQCEIAIGGTLTIAGHTVSIARRRNDLPPITNDQSDRLKWIHGYLLDVYAG